MAVRAGELRCIVADLRKFSGVDMTVDPEDVRICGMGERDQIVDGGFRGGIGVPGGDGCFSFIGTAVGDVEFFCRCFDPGDFDSAGSSAFRGVAVGIDGSGKHVDSVIGGEVPIAAGRMEDRIGGAEKRSRIRFSGCADRGHLRAVVHVAVIGIVPGVFDRIAAIQFEIVPVVGDEIVIAVGRIEGEPLPDAAEISGAVNGSGLVPGMVQRGQKKPGEDRDDRNDDEELDQGKTPFFHVQSFPFVVLGRAHPFRRISSPSRVTGSSAAALPPGI